MLRLLLAAESWPRLWEGTASTPSSPALSTASERFKTDRWVAKYEHKIPPDIYQQVFKGELSFYPLTWILFSVPCLEISTTVRWIITVFCHIKQKKTTFSALFTPHRLFFFCHCWIAKSAWPWTHVRDKCCLWHHRDPRVEQTVWNWVFKAIWKLSFWHTGTTCTYTPHHLASYHCVRRHMTGSKEILNRSTLMWLQKAENANTWSYIL